MNHFMVDDQEYDPFKPLKLRLSRLRGHIHEWRFFMPETVTWISSPVFLLSESIPCCSIPTHLHKYLSCQFCVTPAHPPIAHHTAQLSVRGLCLWNLPLAVPACRELRPRAFVKQARSNAFVGLGKVPHLTLSCGGMWQPACWRVVQEWSTSKADMVNYFCKALRE